MTTGRTYLLERGAPRATLLIRLSVGVIFASEGIQKFLAAVGAGPWALDETLRGGRTREAGTTDTR